MTSKNTAGLLVWALLLLSLGSGAEANAADTVLVATEASFPPFSKTEPDGQVSGFEIDLGNEACRRAHLECQWVKQDFDGLIAGLIAGKYRVIFSSMIILEERKKVVDFSLPYYQTPYRFVSRKDSGIEISEVGLSGKKVGVYAGSSQQKYLVRTFGEVLETRGYDKIDQINADLLTGRIDLSFNDELAQAEFLKTPEGRNFEYVGSEIHDPAISGVGAAFRKGDDALRQQINAAIEAIYADGTFDAIAAKYFGNTNVRADTKW